ncbi:MAG TPA: hypothetical protein VNT58_07210 [Gaiellaceae bacterium]|nr:hypothetical protein [Gaiellaceae bacterium]
MVAAIVGAAFAIFAALSLAPTGTPVAPTAAAACGQNPHDCGNGGSKPATAKPGCGYGSFQNHVGPPGHDRVKGNWDQDQRHGDTAPGFTAADTANYAPGTPQECPGTAGGKK